MFTHRLNLKSHLGTSWQIFFGFLIQRPKYRLTDSTVLAWQGLPFPFHHHRQPRKWFIGNLRISYLPGRDWLCWCRLHSSLLGMTIGIYIPVELQLPTHITGPDTTTTSVFLSSSAFQFPLEPAPLAVTPAKVHLWMNLPFPRLLHLFLNPRFLFWISRNFNVGHLCDF